MKNKHAFIANLGCSQSLCFSTQKREENGKLSEREREARGSGGGGESKRPRSFEILSPCPTMEEKYEKIEDWEQSLAHSLHSSSLFSKIASLKNKA